jgi:hypothetical protein
VSQILNIFKKDVWHHWPEVLASWALLAVYAWDQPRKWANQTSDIRLVSGLLNMLPALLVLSWAFLIARLVQGESLVGDRQFWITRPYVWHKLLAAKLLSMLMFIHVPLFISQIVLLKLGKFPVVTSLWGLVEIQLMFVLILLAGVLAIAVVTSGIGQASLALVIVFLLILGIAGISSLVPNSGMVDDLDGVQGLLYTGCCITVILLQYIRRRTLLSRLVILGTIALIVLVLVFTPYERIIRHNYPLATKDHPLPARLTFDPSLSFAHEQKQPGGWIEDEIQLELPFQVADLDAKSIVQIQAIRLDLELPGGRRWTSHWHSLSNVLSYGRTRTWPGISIEKRLYDKIKDTPVKAHVSLGMRSFRLRGATPVTVVGDRTSLPGNAQCVDDMSLNWLRCFSALRRPKPVFIVAELPNAECRVAREATADESWAASPATYYDLASDSGPDFDLSPVQDFSIGLSRFYFFEDHEIRLPVCSGTRLLVSKPELQYAVRDEIDLGEIALANYHPTYPRKIIPPQKLPAPGSPSDTLSWNFNPERLLLMGKSADR